LSGDYHLIPSASQRKFTAQICIFRQELHSNYLLGFYLEIDGNAWRSNQIVYRATQAANTKYCNKQCEEVHDTQVLLDGREGPKFVIYTDLIRASQTHFQIYIPGTAGRQDFVIYQK